MFDPTIHARTITRQLRKSDFRDDPTLYNPATLQATLDQAVFLGRNGLGGITLLTSKLRNKDVFQVTGLAHNLVLRHVTNNIRRVTGVKQDDRQLIVKCISSLVSEGTAFRVYKFDVKSFYESVRAQSVVSALASDLAFSGQSVRALQSLFSELEANGVSGLPRGMAISATLAEYLLRPFDASMSDNLGVWFYARFVDDIVVITDGAENPVEFSKLASEFLPAGLKFNEKSRNLTFTPFNKGNTNVIEGRFDFLGYEFSVSKAHRRAADKKLIREVRLEMAKSKIDKIKTRVAKSLLAYRKDSNFYDLRDRIRLLTSNFTFVDGKTGAERSSGIYFNYPLVVSGSQSLVALDKFLRSALTVSKPKNKLFPTLTKSQRLLLLRLSFRDGHANKRFFAFKPARLAALTKCWHYA